MKEFLMKFTFKGARNYIQGPDIYTKIVDCLLTEQFQPTNLDLSFHKIARNNLKANFFQEGEDVRNISDPACIFKFIDNSGGPLLIYVTETDLPITESIPFYEEKIIENAELNLHEKFILLATAAPYNNIEKIVALNKALLNQLLPEPGKWYFTKITADKDVNIQEPETIQLKLVKNIGSKITKSVILFDSMPQGYIYFSKV